VCSQAGIPVQASTQGFRDAFKAKFGTDPVIYAPFTYDATNLIISAMQTAGSTDPAKYLPELAKIKYDGASGHIEFDEKGDRKDAEMTIFTMKDGTVTPVAIIKGGQSIKFEEYGKGGAPK
jgi:branched-chain amino acid transport system substrate-binding protein